MFKIGERVILKVDHPDKNYELYKGDAGVIARVFDKNLLVLVRFDKYTETATSNSCEDTNVYPGEEEIHLGHLWWCSSSDLETTKNKLPPFRKQHQNETSLEYKIANKIYKLDCKWREKQNAKTNPISI